MATLPSLGDSFDPATAELIEFTTIAQESRYWDDSSVDQARAKLSSRYGRVPRLEDLAEHFDPAVVYGFAREVVERRHRELIEAGERMGWDVSCHLCSDPNVKASSKYLFGLAKMIEKKTHWGGALAVLALNVVTLPLGVAVGGRPGTSARAHIARCQLVMCDRCSSQRQGFWGGLSVGEHDCKRHPSWGRLTTAGFTTFLNTESLNKYR